MTQQMIDTDELPQPIADVIREAQREVAAGRAPSKEARDVVYAYVAQTQRVDRFGQPADLDINEFLI